MPLFNGTTPISSIWYRKPDMNYDRMVRSVYDGVQMVFPDAIHDYRNSNMTQEWTLFLSGYNRNVYQEREISAPVFDRSVTNQKIISSFFPGGQFRGFQVLENGEYVTSYQTNISSSAPSGFQYQLQNLVYRPNATYELYNGGLWTYEGGTLGIDNTFQHYLYSGDIVGWCWDTTLASAVFDYTSFGIVKNE